MSFDTRTARLFGLLTAIGLATALLPLTGCDQGPAEETGEVIDDAIDDTGDAIDDAADDVDDAIDDATDG